MTLSRGHGAATRLLPRTSGETENLMKRYAGIFTPRAERQLAHLYHTVADDSGEARAAAVEVSCEKMFNRRRDDIARPRPLPRRERVACPVRGIRGCLGRRSEKLAHPQT